MPYRMKIYFYAKLNNHQMIEYWKKLKTFSEDGILHISHSNVKYQAQKIEHLAPPNNYQAFAIKK